MLAAVVIGIVSFLASTLTFFSGFGLGTILLPVFALFTPPGIAVAMTAIVHLANNIGKLALVGRHADRSVSIRFGVPAIILAFVGASALVWISGLSSLFEYDLMGRTCVVTPIKLVIAPLMAVFAVLELLGGRDGMSLDRRYLPLGGALSGFFGGLSGHQGALRSVFLLRCGLTKESFIATGVVVACVVDVVRLVVYGSRLRAGLSGADPIPLLVAVTCALLGAVAGRRLLTKITMTTVRTIVAVMLFAIAAGLGSGIL
jgi:uncharacterized membrane protein YfcA